MPRQRKRKVQQHEGSGGVMQAQDAPAVPAAQAEEDLSVADLLEPGAYELLCATTVEELQRLDPSAADALCHPNAPFGSESFRGQSSQKPHVPNTTRAKGAGRGSGVKRKVRGVGGGRGFVIFQRLTHDVYVVMSLLACGMLQWNGIALSSAVACALLAACC